MSHDRRLNPRLLKLARKEQLMAKIPCESIGIMDYDSRDGLGIYQAAECSQWAVHGRARDALVDQNGRFGGSVAVGSVSERAIATRFGKDQLGGDALVVPSRLSRLRRAIRAKISRYHIQSMHLYT
jgi:hypothetical protein